MSRLGILNDEYRTDPLGRGYSGMTAEQFRTSLTAENRSVVRPLTATAKTLMAQMNPSDAATILDTLEAAAGSNSVVKWTVKFLTGDGIDLGHPNTRVQIQALVDGGVLTQTQADSLTALAEATISRAEEIGAAKPRPWECAHVVGNS